MNSLFSARLASKVNLLFALTVVLPTLVSALYFMVLASDVYISESRFVVRSPEKQGSTGLGLILKGTGFQNSGEESSAAQSAVLSRDALTVLNKNYGFTQSYSRSSVSLFDRFNPFNFDGSFEQLYKYFKKKVSVEAEPNSAITILLVRSYNPADARRFNEQLLQIAEATVNNLNERGRQDLIRFAEREVEENQIKAAAAAQALASFRNREGVVDPERQAALQSQMISKLQDELIATKTELRQLQQIAPRNPQIETLSAKAAELTSEIASQSGLIAGNPRSLAATQARYQQLIIASQTADRQLAGALSSLEEARNEARRKQSYVERVVQPNLPDSPLEPRRGRAVLATFVFGLIAYAALSMLMAGMREHRD